ncbi:hypothetical protein NQ318_023000 [Aromia moschata]|uniref:Ribosomal biogenesis protein LAS1L n=1 Tax=Aromia moschata TaxID=1265417 RepID=A0AAV8YD78_9CUCU|nr:hypothetical protein NQ318_023000 [Aromia moschata]
MSLSQKHSGKVFVPWFNSAEWRKVYQMLCSENERNYSQALHILKIWKYRTPLLSAGVEGTLILLEALLIEKYNLSDEQLSQIHSLSLMRFLNICAANSEKQGTFHKTAVKNQLPKWLISIRHDIAHSHKLPSKAVLELSLHNCLEWVKQKYWEVQKEIIFDYVVLGSSSNPKIIEGVKMYVKLKLNLFFHTVEIEESLIEKINYLMAKKYHKKIDVKDMVSLLEENLKQSLADPSYTSIAEKMTKILVNTDVLLNTQTEVDSEGNEVIARDFRDLWSPLLNILFENGFLFSLLNDFLEVTNNSMFEDSICNLASLWIKEIFQGLQKIRIVKEEIDAIAMDNVDQLDPRTSTIVLKSVIDKKYPQFKGCLEFDSPHCLTFVSAEVFQEKILNFPNNYTLNFWKGSVLRFNKNSENYISDTLTLVKKLIWSTVNITDDEVYTTEHLQEIFGNDMDMEWTDSSDTAAVIVNTASSNDMEVTKKWTLLKDTSPYQGCPLGILPHQKRNVNPLLTL